MRKIILWFAVMGVAALGAFGAMAVQDTLSELSGTSWELVSFTTADGETPVVRGTNVTLAFEDEAQAGGNSGCNGYGSAYQTSGDSITFEGVISTMIACMEEGVMEQESAYFDAINTATRYAIDGDTLTIWYGEGVHFMTFSRVTETPLVATTWRLTAVGETSAVPESGATLIFDTTGRIRGSGGCNNFSGDYVLDDDTVTLSGVSSPLMACDDEAVMQQESAYLTTLDGEFRYEIDGDTLTLWYGDDSMNTLAFEAAQDEFLVGTYWRLTSLITFGTQQVVTPIFEDSDVTLEFMSGGGAAGFGGCNQYTAPYTLGSDGSLTFGEVASTRMACPASEADISHQEQSYFEALGTATSYSISNTGTLLVFYNNGRNALEFTRLDFMPSS